ncbi:hypothetical protein MGH68_18670 [Erysipelothrix sp. D19-032]
MVHPSILIIATLMTFISICISITDNNERKIKTVIKIFITYLLVLLTIILFLINK